ncbi:MAG: TonB-dependent receptor [Acidobacteria bacterium]|nr:MAG: TonB-dependent receptor [Acidobacteriota bacterium]
MIASVLAAAIVMAQFSQTATGDLRIIVADAQGMPVQCGVEIISAANQLRETLAADAAGVAVARRLPFGSYRVVVAREGFAPFSARVDVASALPTDFHVTLALAPVQTQVTVTADDTLLDVHRAAAAQRIGADALRQRTMALPGRSVPELVNTQPGWLLEANGILHPRGSEYQTQYVIDGLPLTDNRSPAFAPELDPDEIQTMNIVTGGYPAEYGRKLGGVIEVVTAAQAQRGFHGGEYAGERTTMSAAVGVAATDRYLDPPVAENFTNRGTTTHAVVHVERELTGADRVGVIVRRGEARFLVPNEQVQQQAGQRQDRDSGETAAQFSYQHLFSAPVLADVRGMTRDLSAGLWSNDSATPIAARQDRGFRELYLKAAASGHAGAHEWKAGGDMSLASVHERFAYRITDAALFNPGTPADFSFDERRADREVALFAQDQIRTERWTINAGLRWDHYGLVVRERAISPRVAVARSWPSADLVVRASYDRAFQTPAVENLLLASSPEVDALSDRVLRLPVRPSHGNFYEAGVTKSMFGLLRLDATWFARRTDNFADDDLLLNTGVSFPIAFRDATIRGLELKADVPHWRSLSGSIGYAWMRGRGDLPITGGLFLGDEANSLLASTDRFPISQDQRHTARGRVAYRLASAVTIALAGAYGSGLPFEFAGDRSDALGLYGERIVDRVDFDDGRVRPSWSLDGSVGIVVAKRPRAAVRVQADVRNLTNRLNVINFAGLFSGTAVGQPRSVAVRIRAEF